MLDSSEYETVLYYLQEARALIENPLNWCQGMPEANSKGKEPNYASMLVSERYPVKWCAVGSIQHVAFRGQYHSEYAFAVARSLLDLSTRKIFGGDTSILNDINIVWVNDEMGHKEVMQVYDLAIQRASYYDRINKKRKNAEE